MTLAEKLSEFYHKYDPVHKGEDKERSRMLFQKLLDKKRVIVCLDAQEELIGFVESWRINEWLLGWYLCHRVYPNLDEVDIENGHICYLANTVIHPDYRFKYVYQYLKTEFFKQNYMCDFFIGQAFRKKHQPLKIFTRQEFYDKYASIESNEGVTSHG